MEYIITFNNLADSVALPRRSEQFDLFIKSEAGVALKSLFNFGFVFYNRNNSRINKLEQVFTFQREITSYSWYNWNYILVGRTNDYGCKMSLCMGVMSVGYQPMTYQKIVSIDEFVNNIHPTLT